MNIDFSDFVKAMEELLGKKIFRFLFRGLVLGAVLLGLKYLIIEVGHPLYSLIREIIIGGINLSDLISLFVLLFSLFAVLLPAMYLILKAKDLWKEAKKVSEKTKKILKEATETREETVKTLKEARSLLGEIESGKNRNES